MSEKEEGERKPYSEHLPPYASASLSLSLSLSPQLGITSSCLLFSPNSCTA